MRRIVLWFMTTVTVVVLLFGYSTSTSGPSAVGGQTSAVAAGDPVSGGSTSTSSSARTVTGASVDTRWGPVQVAITVEGSTITDVTVPVYPTGNGKDLQINSYALPMLIKDTLDAQSADIDMITGATVTSEGYVQSLQSALDEAGL
jgi:uncharacterized protein with FMN-binding domain